MQILENIGSDLISGEANNVEEGVKKALEEGIEAKTILNDGLLKGMGVIGRRFKNGEVFVPEVLIAAKAMKSGMDVLKPKLVEAGEENAGLVLLGTVGGDLHDIGKNMVKMMLKGANFEVCDLGTDVNREKFVEVAKEKKPQVLALSSLLTTTMSEMENVIEVFEEAGLRNEIKIIVGGAPVTKEFANDIGADGYAKDAASAADLVEQLV
jgi:5-methyltetrahydrofolate--homocysteine methyltransferase